MVLQFANMLQVTKFLSTTVESCARFKRLTAWCKTIWNFGGMFSHTVYRHSQLCGKHILAEMKACHLKDARRTAANAYFPKEEDDQVEPIQDCHQTDVGTCHSDVGTSNFTWCHSVLVCSQ